LLVAAATAVTVQVPAVTKVIRPAPEFTVQTPVEVLAKEIVPLALPCA
jgi:hypothetical protein